MTATIIGEAQSGLKRKDENTFLVQLISPGPGSSGIYVEDVLKKDLPVAMPRGTHSYSNHMSKEEREAGRGRKIEDMIGVIQEDPYWNDETKSMVAPVKFRGDVAKFIEDFIDDVAVSIEVHDGEIDESGVITEMKPHPFNSLALVPRGGARGKVLQMIESFRSTESKGGPPTVPSENRNSMDIKEVEDVVAKAIAPVLTALEALKPEAPVEGPKADEIAEAVIASGVSEQGRKAVYNGLASGKSLDEAVKDVADWEKSILESATKTVKDGKTVVIDEGASASAVDRFAKKK